MASPSRPRGCLCSLLPPSWPFPAGKALENAPGFPWSFVAWHHNQDSLPGCCCSLGFGVSLGAHMDVPGRGDGTAPSPASSTQGSIRKDIFQLNPRLPAGTRDPWEVVVVMNSPSRCPLEPGSDCQPQIRKGTETRTGLSHILLENWQENQEQSKLLFFLDQKIPES